MKTRSLCTTVAIAIIGLLLAGCSGTPIRLGSANQYAGPTDLHDSAGRPISASARGFQLLLFIPININDRHERAFQLLQAQAGGDYLTDIAVDESWTWAFVGTVYKTTLTATAYRRSTGSMRPAKQQPATGAGQNAALPAGQPALTAASTAPSLAKMCDMSSLADKAECLGRLRLGMSRALVTNLLGPPTETLGNGNVVRYDDRYLQFDNRDRLTGITETRPQ